MKRLSILCEDSVVEQARERAKSFMGVDVLKIPLSKSGEETEAEPPPPPGAFVLPLDF